MTHPKDDTQYVHQIISQWLDGSRDVIVPAWEQKEVSDDLAVILQQHLIIACQQEAIHYAMESYEAEGNAYYSISPEFIGPIIKACLPNDPVYAQYRHMSFLLERAQQHNYTDVLKDIIRGYFCSRHDVNGGRHKLNANVNLQILPTTPAVGTDYPKAFGTAKSIDLAHYLGADNPLYSMENICIVSGGDGSINQPSALSTFNLAKRAVDLNEPLPLMFVISDNGIAISERSYAPADTLLQHWGLTLFAADAKNALSVYQQAYACQKFVRTHRKPAILVVKTYRLFGHSTNRRNENFTQQELKDLHENHPLMYLMQLGVDLNLWNRQHCADTYHDAIQNIEQLAKELHTQEHLTTVDEIAAPLRLQDKQSNKHFLAIAQDNQPKNLRRMITHTLKAILKDYPQSILYGQDISPGHYGVGIGLKSEFPKQVYGFCIDEIALAGSANGLIWNSILPIVEISYKAYFIEGGLQQFYENMLQRFLSNCSPPMGMIIRMPSLGLVKGGPTHNENCFPERLIPHAKVFCPGTPYSAALCMASAYQLARYHQQAIIFNEPTQQYFVDVNDYFGDCAPLFAVPDERVFHYGEFIVYRFDENNRLSIQHQESFLQTQQQLDCLIYTYGNGVKMALNAVGKLQSETGKQFAVIEYPCLQVTDDLLTCVTKAQKVLIVDECRPIGSPGEHLLCQLIQHRNIVSSDVRLLHSEETFNPSGPAQMAVYLSEEKIYCELCSL